MKKETILKSECLFLLQSLCDAKCDELDKFHWKVLQFSEKVSPKDLGFMLANIRKEKELVEKARGQISHIFESQFEGEENENI